jgi:endo-1,4-beta-xylanase
VATLDPAQTALASSYQSLFKIGVAVNSNEFSGKDAAAAQVVAQQFNRATPENALKWQSLQAQPGQFDFSQADQFLDFAERNGMEIHGHTIVWYQQVPDWVFQPPDGQQMTRELLLQRLEAHMSALSDHFKDRIQYWDVVNEAYNDDGSFRSTQWHTIIGDDYIEQAFRLADQYFPNSKLVYNDFNLETPGKRDTVAKMVRDFKAKGVRIDAVGTQSHLRLQTPTLDAIEASLDTLSATGVEILVSELDVDVLPSAGQGQSANAAMNPALNPYVQCLPDGVVSQVATRWGSLFGAFVRHASQIHSVTIWGVSDAYSWLNNTPVNGRTNYGVLFDRNLEPKKDWQSVIEAAGAAQ